MVWHFIPAVRTERLVFVASTDPRPEKSQAGMVGRACANGRLDTRPRRLVGAHEHVRGIRRIHLPERGLTGLDVPSRILTVQVTRNLLDVWGITPQIGRTFAADEATTGREQVVLVSHDFWQRQLSSRADAIGKTLSIDGRPHTIVGVLPQRAGAGIFRTVDAVTPIVLDRERNKRDDRRLYVTGVLKPGVELEQAEADLAAIARQLQTDYPLTNTNSGVVVRPLLELLGAQHHRRRVSPRVDSRHGRLHRVRERLEHHPRARRDAPPRAGRPLGAWRRRLQQVRQFMIEGLDHVFCRRARWVCSSHGGESSPSALPARMTTASPK